MLPSQTELEDDMSNRVWCDEHPHDCARVQKQQDREWLHSHDTAFGSPDAVAAAVVLGLSVLAML